MIWSGFILGFVGSLHCIGMCGPIALAIPTSQNPFLKFFQIITYNFGRVLTYSLIGLGAGLLGESFRITKIQQYTSIVIGVLLILIVLGTLLSYHKGANKANRIVSKIFSPIKNLLGKFLMKERKNLLAIGILNGFLPCGLIYFAFASAISTGSILESSLYMAFFGLGTIPAMMGLMYFKNIITKKINLAKIVPYALLVMGVLLVMRGMDLNIPYLSPSKQMNEQGVEVLGGCCSADGQFGSEN